MSLALTRGVNVTWLSEQTGVALGTLLKHYGRFIHAREVDRAELPKIEGRKGTIGPSIAHENSGIDVRVRKRMSERASPTGFEPVLPT